MVGVWYGRGRMERSGILAVVVASLALGVPGASGAMQPFTPEAKIAYRIAIEYWGQEPTQCGSLERAMGSASDLPADDIGLATQPEPGQTDIACVIIVQYRMPFTAMCKTMTHEVGHLLGLGHSDDIRSVMYPSIDNEAKVPACSREGERRRYVEIARHMRLQCIELQDHRIGRGERLHGRIASCYRQVKAAHQHAIRLATS